MAANNAGQILGPGLAGALVAFVPVADLLFADARLLPRLVAKPEGVRSRPMEPVPLKLEGTPMPWVGRPS